MNETLNTILKRRSIRNFQTKQLDPDDLNTLLNAALHAPNARNLQTWHFSVIQNADLLNKMVGIIKEFMAASEDEALRERGTAPDYHTFYHAPTVVLISADETANLRQIDGGAAAQTLAVAAKAFGIGSCLIASSGIAFLTDKGQAMKSELGIPEGYEHVICVALGYPDGETPEVPERNTDVIQYIR
jgi:nitroreductase